MASRQLMRMSWYQMIQRCYNDQHKSYQYYGGRGVTVCDRWLHSFDDFLRDVGDRPDGMTLDRIDSNGNYEPGNVRWATREEQRLNQTGMSFTHCPRGHKKSDFDSKFGCRECRSMRDYIRRNS